MNRTEPNHSPHERAHYRIPYQNTESPLFETKDHLYTVIDLSEGGLRLAITLKQKPNLCVLDQEISGTLTLPAKRGSLKLSGIVIRIAEDYLAIKLHEHSHIPLPHIMEEQRLMIQNLPQNLVWARSPGQRAK